MKPHSRLSQQQVQQSTSEQQTTASGAREFAGPEDLLRFDAAQTEVPSGVAQRLQTSLASTVKTTLPWWRKWLGR